MPRPQSGPRDRESSLGSSKFNGGRYQASGGMDPIISLDLGKLRNPTTGIRSSMAGISAFGKSEARLGVHYLRMPYPSRDFYHSLWLTQFRKFVSYDSGQDTNWLSRHPELKLIGYDGLAVDSAETLVAKAHVALIQHAVLLSSHLVLKFVAVMNLVKKDGFGNVSANLGSTVRYPVMNAMFSKIANMPVNKAYIQGCVDMMADLTQNSKTAGLFVACPDWLPLGQTYYEDPCEPISGLFNWADYRLPRFSLHPLPGEYAVTNKRRIADAELTRGWGLADLDTGETTVKYNSKHKGWFYDHYLEQLQAEVDAYYNTFCNNTVTALNLGVVNSQLADYYQSLGMFDDRVCFADVVAMSDSIGSCDMDSYAAENFGKFCEVSPIAIPGTDLALMSDLDNPVTAPSHFELSTCDYLRTASAADAFKEMPYLGLTMTPTGTLDQFLDGVACQSWTWHNAHDAEHDYDTSLTLFDGTNHNKGWARVLSKKLLSFASTASRYVDEASVGKFIAPASDSNIKAYEVMTKVGVFIPFWEMTPVIDPNDRYTNGIFTIVDLSIATPRPGTWEDVIRQRDRKSVV